MQDFDKTVDAWALLQEEYERVAAVGTVPVYAPSTAESSSFAIRKEGEWLALNLLRAAALKGLEERRAAGMIKHSLEAKVVLYLDAENNEGQEVVTFLDALKVAERERFLKDFLIVSHCAIVSSKEGLAATDVPWLYLRVDHAEGVKCPRCWKCDVSAHVDELCRRCQQVLSAH